MDTAQRGMGLDWPNSLELIRRSVAEAARDAGRGRRSPARAPTTSRRTPTTTTSTTSSPPTKSNARRSRALGGRIILMASRALAACARSPDDYAHGLRPRAGAGARAGDPALAGRHVRPGARRLLGGHARRLRPREGDGRLRWRSSQRNAAKVDGIKISLLDDAKEIAHAPPAAAPACACTPATTSTSPR